MSHSYSSNCVHAVYSINDRRNLIVRSQTCVRVREVPRHAQVVRVQLGGLCGVKPAVFLPKRDQI
jgi:hypothetical protein